MTGERRVEDSYRAVATPADCLAFVSDAGLCLWTKRKGWESWPSLEAASVWGADAPRETAFNGAFMEATWFWKDDLHIEKQLFYGQILGHGVAMLASLEMLPFLIAAQGDNDPRTLCERGLLPHLSLGVYEHVERNGSTASNKLPVSYKDRSRSLVPLAQRFLLTKVGLTGRTRGTYGYLWGLADAFFPDAFSAAAHLRVPEAREAILRQLETKHGILLTNAQAAKIFHWKPE
ncbi:MAG: hypothetical protein H7Z41_13145 [Cytophagales bacterium]|nr:hypothetical protein [Armatimonadota bacterium]